MEKNSTGARQVFASVGYVPTTTLPKAKEAKLKLTFEIQSLYDLIDFSCTFRTCI